MTTPQDPRMPVVLGADEHGEWDALAVGWAMSALDWEDEERFAQHLPGCARCTATVRETLYTVADLAYALPDEAPPPSLKERLMAAVAVEPQDVAPMAPLPELPGPIPQAETPGDVWPHGEPHPGTPGYHDWFARPARRPESQPNGFAAAPAGPPEPLRPAESEPVRPVERSHEVVPVEPVVRSAEDADPRAAEPSWSAASAEDGPIRDLRHDEIAFPGRGEKVVPLEPRRRRRRRGVLEGIAAAAAVVIIAALGVSNVQLRSNRTDAQSSAQQVTAQRDSLQRIVAQRDAAIRQLTANGPARIAALTGTGQPSATRQATLVVRGNQVEILIESLGATTGTETYWLWTLKCDTGTPSDLKPIQGFTVSQSEFSVRDLRSNAGVSTATCFALSSETTSGTPTVPRQVVAVGQPK